MKIKNLLRALALLAALLLLTVSAAATAWDDMYENGAISDGSIAFDDIRDGIVSDVSEPSRDEAHSLRNGEDAQPGNGATDARPATDAAPRTAAGSAAAGETAMGGGSMIFGMILAILVIIAVIALVILLTPKRRG